MSASEKSDDEEGEEDEEEYYESEEGTNKSKNKGNPFKNNLVGGTASHNEELEVKSVSMSRSKASINKKKGNTSKLNKSK